MIDDPCANTARLRHDAHWLEVWVKSSKQECWLDRAPPSAHNPLTAMATNMREAADLLEVFERRFDADLLAALKAVVGIADRKTAEFDAARAAIARAEGR